MKCSAVQQRSQCAEIPLVLEEHGLHAAFGPVVKGIRKTGNYGGDDMV